MAEQKGSQEKPVPHPMNAYEFVLALLDRIADLVKWLGNEDNWLALYIVCVVGYFIVAYIVLPILALVFRWH